jgi:DNA-binding response OmpR family regulator
MSDKVLIVDDDEALLKLLGEDLAIAGFEVAVAADGREALMQFDEFEPDLLVLDVTLPTLREHPSAPKDGLEILAHIRKKHKTPIIILSDTHIGTVKILALEMGADDYVTKPFNGKELVARIHAVLRRAGTDELEGIVLEFPGLLIEEASRKVWRAGDEVALTALEFDLLFYFAARPGQVFTRDQIMDRLWESQIVSSAAIDVHVSNLRKKLRVSNSEQDYIGTVRGVGYRFEASGSSDLK